MGVSGKVIMAYSKNTTPLALSSLSAGRGAEIAGDYDDLDVNELITKGKDYFVAYPITGDSMVPTIPSGSVVFVDPMALPQSGQPVVCRLNGLYSVKYFRRSGPRLYLVPANGDYETREVFERDDFEVMGVVKANLQLW